MSEPLIDRVCAECGRVFCPAPYHIFKQQRKGKPLYYCGWNCYSHAKKNRPKPENNGKAKPIDAYDSRGNFIKTFPSIKSVTEETGEGATAIRNCCEGITKATRGGYIFKYKEKEK